jgi:hypothetical protein
MRWKPMLSLLAFGLIIGLLSSCNDGSEDTRSVVTVASLNENQPFFSDVLAQGDSVYDKSGVPVTRDDYVTEDWVKVVFYNKPYDPFNTAEPGDPLGEVLVTNYRVEWQRVDGGTETPNTYNGGTSVLVPSGQLVEGGILLVPFYEKNRAFLQELNYLGTLRGDEVLCVAHLTFWAHEVGAPSREFVFDAYLTVDFGDIVIKTRPEQS